VPDRALWQLKKEKKEGGKDVGIDFWERKKKEEGRRQLPWVMI